MNASPTATSAPVTGAGANMIVNTLNPLREGAIFCLVPVDPPPGGTGADSCFGLARSIAGNLSVRVAAVVASAVTARASASAASGGKPEASDLLDSPQCPLAEAAEPMGEGVDLFYWKGTSRGNDVSVLNSEGFAGLLRRLRGDYGYVLVLLPPAHVLPTLTETARMYDGVVLVVTCEHTRWEVGQDVSGKLRQAGCAPAGVILDRRKFYVPRWLYRRL